MGQRQHRNKKQNVQRKLLSELWKASNLFSNNSIFKGGCEVVNMQKFMFYTKIHSAYEQVYQI